MTTIENEDFHSRERRERREEHIESRHLALFILVYPLCFLFFLCGENYSDSWSMSNMFQTLALDLVSATYVEHALGELLDQ